MAGFEQEFAPSRGGDREGLAVFPRLARERDSIPQRRLFPPEIDFLARAGTSPQVLYSALAATPPGMTAEAALLGEGLMSEEAYYRALARHLRSPYLAGEPVFPAELDAAKAIRCGVAPLLGAGDEPRAVIAPRGADIARLIDATASGRLRNAPFAIASPQRLAALLRARCGPAILGAAIGGMPAEDSARGGLAWTQVAFLAVAASGMGALAALAPHALALILSTVLWLTFGAWIILRSLAVAASHAPRRAKAVSDDDLPVYTVVAPLHREAGVVDDLVRALDALDYPGIRAQTPQEIPRRRS